MTPLCWADWIPYLAKNGTNYEKYAEKQSRD